MSFVYRYTGTDQDLVVRSNERREDLEGWAYWERVDEAEVVSAAAREVSVPVEAAPVVEPAEDAAPVEKPKRRTRKPVEAES